MSWPLFAVVAWVLFGAEIGFKDALRLGPTGVAPSFIIPLLVFVAIGAPQHVVWWTSFTLGLVMDLTFNVELLHGAPPATIVGPYTLGFLLAGQLVITMRGLMMRRNPLTVAFLSVVAAAVCQIVVVGFYTARSAFGDPIVFNPTSELIARLGGALLTGATGLVLALLLTPLAPALGLSGGQPRRYSRRMP